MNKKLGTKIGSVALFVHGFIEVVGAIALVALPSEFLATGGYIPEGGKASSMVALAAIFGLSRLGAGYLTWSIKRWGIVFGVVLSVTTMIAAPLMHLLGAIALPSVIMDLLLAVIVLASLLYVLFGDEVIVSIKR
ncbi:hypothetical protein ES703_28018 [subsurface metagenome]